MERDLLDYSRNYLGPFEAIQVDFRRRKVLEIIKKYNPKEILEVSCGKDSLVNYLDPESYDNFYVVEPIEDFLKMAIKFPCPKIHTFNDIIENIPTLSYYNFHFIVVSGLLHEVIDPGEVMKSIFRISSKDTIIHVNVPNAFSLHRLIAKEAGLIESVYQLSETQKQLQQNHTFDFTTLINLCKNAGFEYIEKGSLLLKPFTHFQMQQLIDQKIISSDVLEGLYKLSVLLPEYGSEIYLNLKKKL